MANKINSGIPAVYRIADFLQVVACADAELGT
jgi:hypothetical protein